MQRENLVKSASICGAGLGGLTTALALANQGIEVSVFERAPELTEAGAGLQLSPNAMHVLRALGLEDAIEEVAFEPEASRIRDYSSGETQVHLPLKEYCRSRYGAPYYHVHRANLHKILSEAAKDVGVEINLNQKATGYTQTVDQVHLQTQNGVFSADVLIGADGLRSTIHDVMLGPQPPAFSGQVAWRGTVATSGLPVGLIGPDVNVWVGPHHHFVAYYVKSGTLLNFVAVQERADWTETDWMQRGDIKALREVFSGWHNDVRKILDATEECYLWALFAREPLARWTDRRVALLGDAAHPMLPFMAQGAAMAVEDAWVLSCKLSSLTAIEAGNAYEATRKPRTSMVQKASLANAKLFHRRGDISDIWQRAKLQLGGWMPALTQMQLDKIYGVNVTQG